MVRPHMNVLVVDVGGSHIKIKASGHDERRSLPLVRS